MLDVTYTHLSYQKFRKKFKLGSYFRFYAQSLMVLKLKLHLLFHTKLHEKCLNTLRLLNNTQNSFNKNHHCYIELKICKSLILSDATTVSTNQNTENSEILL